MGREDFISRNMIVDVGAKIGAGTYGEIYRVSLGKKRQSEEAIKRFFVIRDSDFGFSYRELDICKKLSSHPNICGASTILYSNDISWPSRAPNGTRSDSLCLIMPLAKGDLCHLCESEVLSEVKIKRITAQILFALEFMHNSGYVHRDIKPTNILYYDGDRIKICDFGLSKRYFPYDDHSSLAASDYFRPPEVLSLVPTYGYGIDIWSLGCTVHYMHCSNMPCPEWKEDRPYNSIAQVQAIIDSLPYEVSQDTLMDDPIGRHLSYEVKIDSDQFFSDYREDIKDINKLSEFLLGGMLMFDQRHRLTARQLLDHEYMKDVSTIARARKTQIPELIESEIVTLRRDRSCCTALMYKTYETCSRLDWYRDKVLFTAITMFDRVLSIIIGEHPNLAVSELQIQTYYRACLYISAKYYSASTNCDLRYDKFPFQELKHSTKQRAADLEAYIVEEVFKGCIYQVSIYDIALNHRRPREKDTASLLDFIIRGAHNGLTSQQAYERWEDLRLNET